MNTAHMAIKMAALHKGHRAGLTSKGSVRLVVEHVVLQLRGGQEGLVALGARFGLGLVLPVVSVLTSLVLS